MRVQRRAVPSAAASRAVDAHLFADLEEHLAAAEDLRANGAGAHVMRRFHDTSAEVYRADQQAEVIGGLLVRLTNLTFTVGTALLLAIGVGLQRTGAITVGTLLVLFQYAQLIRRPLERIIDQLKQLQAAQAGVVRAEELFEQRSSLTWLAADEAERLPGGPLPFALEDVSFSYGDEEVLHRVDLRLAAGRSLGLVGRTGSGKSTITRLLLRLYDPTSGARDASVVWTCERSTSATSAGASPSSHKRCSCSAARCGTTSRCSVRIRRPTSASSRSWTSSASAAG